MDSFTDVPTFVAVVEAGGFSIAARRLNVSRSAVGKAVARLEERLGVRLFQRTTRSQCLTDDGQAFYERCLRALDELRAGTAQLESGRKRASGKLRVSMPVLFGRLYVAPALTRLAALHPDLELALNFNDRHVDLVEDGFDLAIRNGPLRDAASLMSRLVARQKTKVYAAPSYLERHGPPQTLDELPRHRAVVYERSGRLHPWRFPRDDGQPREVTPPTHLRFDDLGAIADAATAGFGLGWMPDWLVRDRVGSGELVEVLGDVAALSTDIYAIWSATPHLPMRMRAAIDAMAVGGALMKGWTQHTAVLEGQPPSSSTAPDPEDGRAVPL